MIRIPTPEGYLLARHQDHARLAGRFAEHWGNALFHPPAPVGSATLSDIITAVARHDDAWAGRDASPLLTRQGRPSAFTRELVGAYSAFEEIDLPDYLRVRGEATEAVAGDNPLAAIIISMHTVNLLTEQADLATIKPEERPLHAAFIEGQLARQHELAATVAAAGRAADTAPALLRRAFEFLQACDNLSLLVCCCYDQARPLRHRHPDTAGELRTIEVTPLGGARYRLAPWPFDQAELHFEVPARRVPAAACADLAAFRAAYAAATEEMLPVHLVA